MYMVVLPTAPPPPDPFPTKKNNNKKKNSCSARASSVTWLHHCCFICGSLIIHAQDVFQPISDLISCMHAKHTHMHGHVYTNVHVRSSI